MPPGKDPQPDAKAAASGPGGAAQPAAAPEPFARFLDLPIEVSVQLDRKKVKVHELLGLRTDSIIRLERSAGENVDLLFDGVVVGSGEIVVIEDMMGLRLTALHFGHSHEE